MQIFIRLYSGVSHSERSINGPCKQKSCHHATPALPYRPQGICCIYPNAEQVPINLTLHRGLRSERIHYCCAFAAQTAFLGGALVHPGKPSYSQLSSNAPVSTLP